MIYQSRRFWAFKKIYKDLPEQVKRATEEAYKLFARDPSHPSLRFKPLQGFDDLYSVRVNDQYRAVGVLKESTVYWEWIGTKNDFMNRY